jgi:hypothetical protein
MIARDILLGCQSVQCRPQLDENLRCVINNIGCRRLVRGCQAGWKFHHRSKPIRLRDVNKTNDVALVSMANTRYRTLFQHISNIPRECWSKQEYCVRSKSIPAPPSIHRRRTATGRHRSTINASPSDQPSLRSARQTSITVPPSDSPAPNCIWSPSIIDQRIAVGSAIAAQCQADIDH